jgi:hypothetical protein
MKEELINDQFEDEELDALLEHLGEVTGDINKTMDDCYKEIMFIGLATHKGSDYQKDVFQLNLRLCIRHNKNVENYLRLKELNDLVLNLGKTSNVEVDKSVIDNILICSN